MQLAALAAASAGVGATAARSTKVAVLADVLRAAGPGPSLGLAEVDRAFAAMAEVSGAGAVARRRALLVELFARATGREQRLLAGLVGGELRQGAQAGLVTTPSPVPRRCRSPRSARRSC